MSGEKLNEKEQAAQKLILEDIEKALNLLVDHCETLAKKIGSKVVSIEFLKKSKTVLLNSLKEGAK